MLEHAIYSVISPEGCASILWRSANESEKAAHSLKLTAQDLLELGIIDEIIQEPVGGAHRNLKTTCQSIKEKLIEKYLVKDNIKNQSKSTNINVLLNRVRTEKKNESMRKLYFSAAASTGLVLFGLLIF